MSKARFRLALANDSLPYIKVSNNQDQARLIAERVARRLAAEARPRERHEPASDNGVDRSDEKPRARLINFISSTPPAATRSSIGSQNQNQSENYERPVSSISQVAQSPWLAPFSRANEKEPVLDTQIASHPSQERFGVEEAAVSELVEFFENEKQCSVDPSGKPCDHCAMCSSRGF